MLHLFQNSTGYLALEAFAVAALGAVDKTASIKAPGETETIYVLDEQINSRVPYGRFDIVDVKPFHIAVYPVKQIHAPVHSPDGNIMAKLDAKTAALVILETSLDAEKRIGDF